MSYEILRRIHSPSDVKKLNKAELPELCNEIREEILDTVSANGGHLASNLGIVELTVALHRVFSTPEDQIVWDVGHQCYAHKLLTGRFDDFSSLRTEGGISGFTNPRESVHDVFFSGHSSTSISAAYGLAMAKKIKGEKGKVIAVIGDGSLTGGEAYEGLNNAAHGADNLIIVINDNQMSISKNTSSLASFFTKIRSSKRYYINKKRIDNAIAKIPFFGRMLRRRIVKYKYFLKSMLYHSSFFEDLGYGYLGPVDGHNTDSLVDIFSVAASVDAPVIVHVDTVKGKGYKYAEADPEKFHGIGKFNKDSGETAVSGMNFSKAFSKAICSFADKDKRVCAVTAAMPSGTGLDKFREDHPHRYFDVGIAEQHAVTFSSGLAKNGMLPFFAVYSTFLQRSYDQIIHDISLQQVKIIIAVDRAGFVGEDGETHQGLFDIPMLNTIPDMVVYAPASYAELAHHMYNALYKEQYACAVRYPRGKEFPLPEDYRMEDSDYQIYGDSDSCNAVLVTYGRLFSNACTAAEMLKQQGMPLTVIKLNKVKPISEDAVTKAAEFKNIYFYEESIKSGCVGEGFANLLEQKKYIGNFNLTAVDNTFVKPASVEDQLRKYGLDAESMARDIGENFE